MTNSQPLITDLFTFDPEYQYTFHLVGGIKISGYVIEPKDNGIILHTMEHIPTDKIIFFVPIISN
jgi:hypothetical protein